MLCVFSLVNVFVNTLLPQFMGGLKDLRRCLRRAPSRRLRCWLNWPGEPENFSWQDGTYSHGGC